MQTIVHRFHNLNAFYAALTEFIIDTVGSDLDTQPIRTLCLCGGKTPGPLHELLAFPPYCARMPWAKIHFFLGDERFVGPTHPDSNYAMTQATLFSKAPVPAANIHPIPTSLPSPEAAAEAYSTALRDVFKHLTPQTFSSGQFPCFDLVLLGMGTDGHTASLFPGSSALTEQSRWVSAVTPAPPGSSPAVPRITLTLPVINNARTVAFLVTGADKRELVETILRDPQRAALAYPAARVRARERLCWFLC